MTKNTQTILVVDDDMQVLKLLHDALQARGYNVLTANRSARALEILESVAGMPVRLVVIDLVMPDIDGVDLAARIGAMRDDIKILVMSGYADDIVVHGEFDGHNVEFISKPFEINQMCRTIEVLAG